MFRIGYPFTTRAVRCISLTALGGGQRSVLGSYAPIDPLQTQMRFAATTSKITKKTKGGDAAKVATRTTTTSSEKGKRGKALETKGKKEKKGKASSASHHPKKVTPPASRGGVEDRYYPYLHNGAGTNKQSTRKLKGSSADSKDRGGAGGAVDEGGAMLDTFRTLFMSQVPRSQHCHVALAEQLSGANMVVFETVVERKPQPAVVLTKAGQVQASTDPPSPTDMSDGAPSTTAATKKTKSSPSIRRPKLFVRGEAYPKRFSRSKLRFEQETNAVVVPKAARDSSRETLITIVTPKDDGEPLRTLIASGTSFKGLRTQAKNFCKRLKPVL